MDLHIDKADRLPLAEQVAAEIRRAITEGEAGPGDRLPLVKDLAAVMGVNKNTVLRALHVLRELSVAHPVPTGEPGYGRPAPANVVPNRTGSIRTTVPGNVASIIIPPPTYMATWTLPPGP